MPSTWASRLKEAAFQAPPVVEISGSANFGENHPQLKIIGHAAAADFTYKSVPFSDLSADFSWDGERCCSATSGCDIKAASSPPKSSMRRMISV